MNAKDIIKSISDKWFFFFFLMFDLFCSHKLTENSEISIAFRTGQGRIEYNPDLVEIHSKNAEKLLATEIYRILLKHPYERVPPEPNRIALKKASDITIHENCQETSDFMKAKYYNLKEKQSYEDYYKEFKSMYPNPPKMPGSGGAGEAKKTLSKKQQADYEASELWAEDEKISERIQSQIEKAARTKQWGSIGELLIEKILAKKNIRMDYKRILAKFRTSVMSSQRSLTRLRPNRRYGYEYMGSRYKDTVKLLIAVDSSGSISQEDLENFFSIINRFFKYGAKEIKVIVFDTQITQEMDFKKARESLKIKGRGGTDFQAAIDYYEHSESYDGLIFFTDGYAEKPKVSRKKRILWILNDKKSYAQNRDWIQKIAGSEITWIGKAV